MNIRSRTALIVFLMAPMVGCGVVRLPTPTPLPGWQSPVSELFVEESAFPKGWINLHPEDIAHPTANYVYRSWGRVEAQIPGRADQQISRAYTIADAKEVYSKWRVNQFQPSQADPYSVFVPFEPPDKISLQSQAADEFYLACGWRTWAYCAVVARYRNYVVLMRLPREARIEGYYSQGLSYAEIESVIQAMDTKFTKFIEELDSLPTPMP